MASSLQKIQFLQRPPFWIARFSAMACPCEVLIATPSRFIAEETAQAICDEVWRIQAKYSRYTDDGVINTINNAEGRMITLDDETRDLFIYAQHIFALSDGLFDISSGCLKNLWAFHQYKTISAAQLPTQSAIDELLPRIGLDKAILQGNELSLPNGMQIDLGGIGKEYAADKSLLKGMKQHDIPILVNLGGDIVASPCITGRPWHIGINDGTLHRPLVGHTDGVNRGQSPTESLSFTSGAVTTSGTSQRAWFVAGQSYSHLLNPKTGWPVLKPPISVTVTAASCTEAGMLSTLIMLQGEQAEEFAKREHIKCWIHR
jgi:thiamine biosynthesis lipoprotein